MTRNEIIAAVRARMDEINPLQEGTTIADPQIEAQLDYAAVNLMEMLPSVLAYPVDAGATDHENYIEDYSIDIICPADFLRLHKLKLTDWNRSISDLLPANHPKIDLQIYKHVKATVNKPIGVLSRNATRDIITCFPAPDDELYVVEQFLYVKKPDNAESLQDDLIDLLTWVCASMIYSIHGQPSFANLAKEKLMQGMEGKLKYRS